MMQDESFVVDLYIRVSTDRQVNEGDSLEEQENELKKFCDYRKFHIHRTLIEKGRSGGNTNRPEYQELINDVRQKRINAVVVKKLDRLSRSLLDFEQLMILLNENNVEFISLKESFDTTSAMGKAMLRVALVFAQLEREQTSERITDVMEYRATKGIYNGGNRPYGYANANKGLIPFPKEREVVEIIFKLFQEDKSTTALENILNAQGYKTRDNKKWDCRAIHKILKNPIYTGKMKWGGKYYQGLHQPIVSEDTFNAVQKIFQSRNYRRPGQRINGLLKGILFCECGSEMKPNYTRKTQSGKEYFYYRCAQKINNSSSHSTCKNTYLNMDDTDDKVIQRIQEYANDDLLRCIQARIDRHNHNIDQILQSYDSAISTFETILNDIKAKKNDYYDSMVLKDFTAKERELINQKIAEFSDEEKQISATINRQRFERHAKQIERISIDDFKREIKYFSINQRAFTDKERFEWVHKQVMRVTYTKNNRIEISFRLLQGLP